VNPPANTANAPIERTVVCGGGLAGHMTAAALARQLPPAMQIAWVNHPDSSDADLFYGSVGPPAAYAFNLAAGVAEPRLILDTSTMFSWGTKFVRWGADNRSWIQCFHLPLPVIGGVLFHQYLARLRIDELEPFLTSAVAARHGVFAHPLEKGPPLLTRVEYGYQCDPQSYREPFGASARSSRVEVIPAHIARVECEAGAIAALHLSDGQVRTADLYVDCTGPEALLSSSLGAVFSGNRRLRAVTSCVAADGAGAPPRTVTACEFGWQSATPLQKKRMARLTVFPPEAEAQALLAHGEPPERTATATLGRRAEAWIGNCVAIGQAACVLEPLTHAPMLLLQRDIERLLSLIPFSTDMSVERREFNRQSAADYTHAQIFHRALFETQPIAQTPYWQAAREEPVHQNLADKIAQFESRGLLVAFDLEPFNAEDWTIQHYGIGRRPARHDRVADRAPEAEVRQFLDTMRRDIDSLVKRMPAIDDYMADLIRYLVQQKW
jgi:tryptophan 7-halogenase